MPLFLLANAPKANTFAMDLSILLSTMRLGWWSAGGALLARNSVMCSKGASGSWAMAGITCLLGMMLYSMASWGGRREIRGVVLRNPCRGLFIWPFAIAGLGFKYFRIYCLLMLGHPQRKPCLTVFRRVDMGGLPSNWWAHFTAFMRLCTKCVNVAIAR
jgi:hypothetical protein